MSELRVVDDGRSAPWRSQALWHGIAAAMRPRDRAVLSFCRPDAPYVSIGLHRSRDEVDAEACARRGWPVIRRRIGGGPVYLDRDQLFFQITLPARRAPARVDRLYRVLLSPAVTAFRALGVAAELRGSNDVAVEDRRLSGTGAGRIGDAVTVVGNVLFEFPHHRMVECLALPGAAMRTECERLMRRHVTTLAREGQSGVTAADARRALVAAYSSELGLAPRRGELEEGERREVDRWTERLRESEDPPASRCSPDGGRQVKICSGVWVHHAAAGGLEALLSVVDGRLEQVSVSGPGLNGEGARLAAALRGGDAERRGIERRLRPFGDRGRRLARLLAPGLRLEGG